MIASIANNLLREWDGPLTRDLLLLRLSMWIDPDR